MQVHNIIIHTGDSLIIVLHGPRGLDKLVLFTLHLWNSFDLFDCNISHTFTAKSLHIKLKTNQKKSDFNTVYKCLSLAN